MGHARQRIPLNKASESALLNACARKAREQNHDGEFFDNATDDHPMYGCRSIRATPDSPSHRIWEHFDNNPSPGRNNGSDTSDLHRDATTIHSRKKDRRLHQARHTRQGLLAAQPLPEEIRLQSAVEGRFQHPRPHQPLRAQEWRILLLTAPLQKIMS